MACSKPATKKLNILLVGRTGNGKSSAGNSILMKDGVFKASSGMSSETRKACASSIDFQGIEIKVVDTPGIGDTELSREKCFRMVETAASQALEQSPDGYHAILIVLKSGNRYTKEEHESIKDLMKFFGPTFITKHGVILITNGDELKRKSQQFEDFIEESKNQNENFKEVLDLCENRCILFNNTLWPNDKDKTEKKKKKEKSRENQVEKLIQLIIANNLHLQPYTDDKFKAAQENRDRLILETKASKIREDIKIKKDKILKDIEEPNSCSPKKRLEKLKEAIKEIKRIKKDLKAEANGTDAFAEAEETLLDLRKSLDREKEALEENAKKEEEKKRNEKAHQNEVQKKDALIEVLQQSNGKEKTSGEPSLLSQFVYNAACQVVSAAFSSKGGDILPVPQNPTEVPRKHNPQWPIEGPYFKPDFTNLGPKWAGPHCRGARCERDTFLHPGSMLASNPELAISQFMLQKRMSPI